MAITCCMGCTERTEGCHGKCEKYAEYKAKLDADRTLRQANEPINEYMARKRVRFADMMRRREKRFRRDGGEQ